MKKKKATRSIILLICRRQIKRLPPCFFHRRLTSFFFNGFVLLFLISFAFAHAQQPVFKNYTVKDGLPSSEVYHVLQDSKGFMWFCTDAGVSRYDGYMFRNFSTIDGLCDNTVFGSFEDRKGRIWFRTMSGKLSYFFQDSIYSIGANERIASEMRNGIITSMYVDPEDTIWCGIVIGKGYYKIAPPYKAENFQYILTGTRSSYLLNIDTCGYIWGGSILDKNNQFSPLTQPLMYEYGKKGIMNILNTSSWLSQSSVFLKTKTGDIIVAGKAKVLNLTRKEEFKSGGNEFISLYKAKNNSIWSGKLKGGVFCFPNGQLKQTTPGNYLREKSVSSITEDSEGGFWFTTLENGVYYMASADLLYFDKEGGLAENKVLTLLEKDSSHILAGMVNGMIALIGKDTIENLKVINSTLFENHVYKFHQGIKSNYIIAGAHRSFSFQPAKKYRAEYFLNGKDSISIKCFALDKQGNVWGGNYLFLYKIDPIKRTTIETYMTKSRILSLYCDTDNRIWLGCVNGLWTFKDGIFEYYGDKNPLFKNRIEDIQVSGDHTWWMATKGSGVLIKRKDSVRVIDMAHGLSSNICKNIYIDKEGIIWVGTNKGINKIVLDAQGKYVIEVYSSDDGLLSNEINQVVRTGNCLWAATNHGIVLFDVRKTFMNSSPPPVYITSLEINTILKRLSDTIRLQYFENYLKIGFIGLSYKRNEGLRYKFKLEGLDSVWHYTRNYSLQYTTLPPGNYTFKVYAINNDGVESKKPAELSFIIAKPFWKKWWFIIMLAITLLTLTATLINYRIQVFKKKAVEKIEMNRKFAELELKALRAQMNPHFIFNSLNSIQRFILKDDTDSAHKYLSKFSKLIRSVLENSRHEYITFSEELQSLELYIELERLRFSSKFKYKFAIGEGINTENVLISPMLIQPYVENAIWHGLMQLKDKEGKLTIGIEKYEDMLKCFIDDNGIGRENSIKLKTKPEHKSMGLSLTRERVEIINSIHHSHMSVTIIDKQDKDGSPTGTRVEIFLPFVQKRLC